MAWCVNVDSVVIGAGTWRMAVVVVLFLSPIAPGGATARPSDDPETKVASSGPVVCGRDGGLLKVAGLPGTAVTSLAGHENQLLYGGSVEPPNSQGHVEVSGFLRRM